MLLIDWMVASILGIFTLAVIVGIPVVIWMMTVQNSRPKSDDTPADLS